MREYTIDNRNTNREEAHGGEVFTLEGGNGGGRAEKEEDTLCLAWPLQDIRSLQRFCERANRHFHLKCPHCCKGIARLLRKGSPSPTLFLYALHHALFVMAILCEGRAQLVQCGCVHYEGIHGKDTRNTNRENAHVGDVFALGGRNPTC